MAELLLRGETYGLPGAAVSRIETHCSVIYLVGNQAYKLKRPVAFSSVDYRTLAQRAAACQAELDLNRRTAPELYLGNHTIRRRVDGTLGLDGEGEIVDWLVAMRRFDQADLFDHLAEAAQLSAATITDLAAEIAGFHQHAEITAWSGGAVGLHQGIEQNHRDLLSTAAILGEAGIERLHVQSLAALEPLTDLLDRRRSQGKVRRVHGDLRLANICLLDGRPTLFDGIEFSDALSCIDILYDLASLLTDLHHRNETLLANTVFNRYLDAIMDSDDLEVFPLMLSIRAATRAYGLAGSAQRRSKHAEVATFAASAKSMLGLALALLQRPEPRLVALGGLGGSHKSFVVGQIATELPPIPGAQILRSDLARRKIAGIAPNLRLTAEAYRAETGDRTYETLAKEAGTILDAGHSVVVDASFFYPHHRRAVHALADAVGVPFTGLWLGDARGMLTETQDRGASDWPAIGTDDLPHAVAAALRLTGGAPI